MGEVVNGYYKASNDKFYADSSYQTEITGESGKVYHSLDTGINYHWNGSGYEVITLVFREVLHDPGTAEGDYQSLFPHYINKIKYDVEPVWSANTRRNSSAKMTGKLVAHKYKLEITWKVDLPQNKLATLRSYFCSNQEWHKIMFTNELGQNITREFYVGSYSIEPYCFWNGLMLYQSIGVTLIER